MQQLTGASYSAGDDAKANGMLSTWGKGITGPSIWKDAGCVHPSLEGVKMVRSFHRPFVLDSIADFSTYSLTRLSYQALLMCRTRTYSVRKSWCCFVTLMPTHSLMELFKCSCLLIHTSTLDYPIRQVT